MSRLTHIDEAGRARMVDVSGKADTVREAFAEGLVRMPSDLRDLALGGKTAKGNVLAVAEIAGVMAAKRTAELIPLCHPLALTRVVVAVEGVEAGLRVTARTKVSGPTGVEMEALTAVSVACLTIYDMLKAADKGLTIEGVRLLSKSGGKSGAWMRDESA